MDSFVAGLICNNAYVILETKRKSCGLQDIINLQKC